MMRKRTAVVLHFAQNQNGGREASVFHSLLV